MEPTVLIIVPSYNEADNILTVLQSLHEMNSSWDILVINDCSTDDTAKIVESSNLAILVSLPYNLGIGGAVQTGFKYAARKGYDIAVQFDGDGQHQACEIRKILEPIISNQAEVVIGSRFLENHNGWKSTRMRRIGIKIFDIITFLLIRQRFTDNTSGFRAYNKRAIQFLARSYSVDYPEPETIVVLKKNGFILREVAASMQERRGGDSSIMGLYSIYYMVKVILAVIIASIKPRHKNL
jgi:glycosyltransferase involved in cell wall biosynthesis